jgi:CheY-like chemotaxis protein
MGPNHPCPLWPSYMLWLVIDIFIQLISVSLEFRPTLPETPLAGRGIVKGSSVWTNTVITTDGRALLMVINTTIVSCFNTEIWYAEFCSKPDIVRHLPLGIENVFITVSTVAAVPDGLKAWEILKGRPHNIDLILTEVDLPSISGFALLTLITEHEICKNIPVISKTCRMKALKY